MARWKITITGKGVRKASVEKLTEKLKADFGEGVSIHVEDATPPESRSERFQDALAQVSDARSEVESLRDELQDWVDGMPENLQNGTKAEEINDAIGALDDVVSDLENVEGADVSFPSMM